MQLNLFALLQSSLPLSSSQSSFCLFHSYCSGVRKKKSADQTRLQREVVHLNSSCMAAEFKEKGKSNPGSEFSPQSSLARTCQTMRWLRSALPCSFMGGSSPSSTSPSSSPKHTQRHPICL